MAYLSHGYCGAGNANGGRSGSFAPMWLDFRNGLCQPSIEAMQAGNGHRSRRDRAWASDGEATMLVTGSSGWWRGVRLSAGRAGRASPGGRVANQELADGLQEVSIGVYRMQAGEFSHLGTKEETRVARGPATNQLETPKTLGAGAGERAASIVGREQQTMPEPAGSVQIATSQETS